MSRRFACAVSLAVSLDRGGDGAVLGDGQHLGPGQGDDAGL